MGENVKKCPFEDLSTKNPYSSERCKFHKTIHRKITPSLNEDTKIKLNTNYLGNYKASGGSAAVLKDIGGADKIRILCTRFYALAFKDFTLSKFMFKDDGAAAHGQRLGDWIVEKMGGEGAPWSRSGRDGMRQVSHHMAWNSEKRPKEEKGRRFKLADCRVWMRLNFLAARQCGLDEHKAFWNWYVQFLAHFVAVYERSAPAYAQESAEWSGNEENVRKYMEDDNWTMKEILKY